MILSARFAGKFSSTIRKRGEDYFRQRRVRIDRGSDTEVAASVRGSQAYYVELDWSGDRLSVWCECPYFVDNGLPCKHLWAAMLAAEAQGYLSPAVAAVDAGLVCNSDDEDWDLDDRGPLVPPPSAPPAIFKVPAPPPWRKQFSEIFNHRQLAAPRDEWSADRAILYVVDVPSSLIKAGLVLTVQSRDRKADGSWKPERALSLKREQIAHLPLLEDREVLSALAGAKLNYGYGYLDSYERVPESFLVPHDLAGMIMPRVTRAGRCYLRLSREADSLLPLAWDDGCPWNFRLEMRRRDHQGWAVTGVLCRGEERLDLAAPVLVTQGGFVITRERVAPLAVDTSFEWVSHFRKTSCIEAPEQDTDELLTALLCSPGLPLLDLPEELQYEEVMLQPRPCLRVGKAEVRYGSERLVGELSFDYDGRIAPALDPAQGFYEASHRRLVRRDSEAEKAAAALLDDLGVKHRAPNYWNREPGREVAPSKLPRVVRALVEAGWHIEAEGKIFRRPGAVRIQVSSGVDWFELHGEVEYGDSAARLPALLEALRRGDKMVRLDNGNYGILPEEWLRRFGPVVGMGAGEDEHIRFRPSQVGLLDALLAAQPEARCDETFARIRKELRLFQGVEAAEQPEGFVGHLRDYQLEGLGWMQFLQRFSFGGCLADDMGVGKTAQVLALLETRRTKRAAGEAVGPSLVVVPKSLVFNWREETERFTPSLRVLDYTGLARDHNDFAGYDVVLTTYGTLRRDAVRLKHVEFDYVILDEAQAVKNANTESAKAVRLLRGSHRLAMSGTPVENHLGELWSLFEFLNPGMLGAASVFKLAGGAMRNPDEETRQLLAHALRPFILRRTKEQVARELPSKSEQTIHCVMEPAQRKLYDELRQHYRNSLLQKIETDGLAKSKIQVLEALLRLRQAACHPGLVDKKRSTDPSAKLDVLLARLREVFDEGHKALVFSQFTSLLRIVRNRLDGSGVTYEYLDGATRDRQARVERFQSDPDCHLFLVSLKAGGLGLNLTAADYVFLLDPWWNPAVEAQAVDRSHRIGQTRQVFAYRLITRDTVEEKVLELQKTKRDLADAIIGADNSLIRDLRPDDLALLLS
jgi:superfamily II DNA or RNA helicase